MPRHARIDAPGALHHVIVRGIARSAIFYDNGDRDRLIDRIRLQGRPSNYQILGWRRTGKAERRETPNYCLRPIAEKAGSG
jgi:REP element-mobilizing transposase RayT